MKDYFTHGISATASGPLEVDPEKRFCEAETLVEDSSQPSVIVSVRGDDPTILEAFIDRTASQQRIISDLRRELRKFAVPYRRDLDKRILKAIRVHLEEGATFEEASICLFGNPDSARAIRYWRNKWGIR
jgi:hypothetical protein